MHFKDNYIKDFEGLRYYSNRNHINALDRFSFPWNTHKGLFEGHLINTDCHTLSLTSTRVMPGGSLVMMLIYTKPCMADRKYFLELKQWFCGLVSP